MTLKGDKMLSRTLGRGAVVVGVALVIAGSPAAAIAGEDDPGSTPPPVTETQPTPPPPPAPAPPPAPVPVVPAPQASPAPAPKAPTHKKRSTKHHQTTQPVVERTATVSAVTTTDTQTIPQGGIQAGEGGTSQHGSSSALLGAGSGLLAFGIAAGIGARRRRSMTR
jgi:outer membrane biosynthesis protein TonB